MAADVRRRIGERQVLRIIRFVTSAATIKADGGAGNTMHGLNTHPIERLLHRLADVIWRHPRWFVYPQIALLAVALGYSAKFLQFKTDTNDLVASDVEPALRAAWSRAGGA